MVGKIGLNKFLNVLEENFSLIQEEEGGIWQVKKDIKCSIGPSKQHPEKLANFPLVLNKNKKIVFLGFEKKYYAKGVKLLFREKKYIVFLMAELDKKEVKIYTAITGWNRFFERI